MVDCLDVSKQHEEGRITAGDTSVCEERGWGEGQSPTYASLHLTRIRSSKLSLAAIYRIRSGADTK